MSLKIFVVYLIISFRLCIHLGKMTASFRRGYSQPTSYIDAGEPSLSNVTKSMQLMSDSTRRVVLERQIAILHDAVKECGYIPKSSNEHIRRALSLRLVELTELLSYSGGQSGSEIENSTDSLWASIIERFPTSVDIAVSWLNYKRSIFISFSGNIV